MGLSDLVTSGIALANTITADLQDTVTHEAWTGNDGFGDPTYAAGVSRQALVEMNTALVRDTDGNVTMSKTKLTILGPITANGSGSRQEPIDPRDRFSMPDGSTGSVLAVEGLVKPSLNYPYMFEVYLG